MNDELYRAAKKAMLAIQKNLQRWNYKDENALLEAYKDLKKAIENIEEDNK